MNIQNAELALPIDFCFLVRKSSRLFFDCEKAMHLQIKDIPARLVGIPEGMQKLFSISICVGPRRQELYQKNLIKFFSKMNLGNEAFKHGVCVCVKHTSA